MQYARETGLVSSIQGSPDAVTFDNNNLMNDQLSRSNELCCASHAQQCSTYFWINIANTIQS